MPLGPPWPGSVEAWPDLPIGVSAFSLRRGREVAEQHRASPACAGCHRLMDPIGFSLENFDASGAWRINDDGFRIDPSGQLFDGTKVNGPVSLREALVGRSDAFIRSFTENLLMFALGRVLEYSDMPVVRSICRDSARNNSRFSSIVLGIVNSTPFQMRRAEAAAAQALPAGER